MDTAAIFDVLRVKRTELAGKAKQWIAVYLTSPEQPPNSDIDAQSDESEPSQLWQHYGFASRPPADAESFTVRAGATFAVIASRVASDVFGKLGVGDVALFTIAGNVLRFNAKDASVTLLVPDGSKQWVVNLKPGAKGGLRIVTPGSMTVEMSDENGITLNAGNRQLTLAGKSVQIVSQEAAIASGAIKLGVAAVKPLSTPGGPVPNVFVM